MAYQLIEFDGVPLPLYNAQQDHSPDGSGSALVNSTGSYFDQYGSSLSQGQQRTISIRGVYLGETEYMVDESGVNIVDETGDYIITGSDATMLRSQITALAEKVRARGPLWRTRLDDGALQWVTARFLRMSQPQNVQDRDFKAEISCDFESAMEYWHAETATTASISATASVTTSLTIENSGQTVKDGIITVTRTSGTVTAFTFACPELGISWTWTGSLGSGDVLTIDAGARTVIKGTSDAYSGMSFSGHTAAGWLPLPQGLYAFNVRVTGGNATVGSSIYFQAP